MRQVKLERFGVASRLMEESLQVYTASFLQPKVSRRNKFWSGLARLALDRGWLTILQ